MIRLIDRVAVPALLATMLASTALAQAPVPGDFVLFADDTIRAKGLVVQSGDVGANLSITATKPLQAPTSRIITNAVDLDKGSTCHELLAKSGLRSPGCGPLHSVALPIIANLPAACGITSPLPTQCSGQPITVGHGATLTRTPGTYGLVDVKGGGHGPGTLVLTAGTYTFCNLTLHRNAQLLARGPVTIRVVGSIKFDNGSNVGPETSAVSPCQVQIFANGTRVRISRKAEVAAILCAPNAQLEMTVGAHLRGQFFANSVKTDKVTLVKEVCVTPPTTSTTTTSTTSTTGTTQPGSIACCVPSSVDGGFPGTPGGAFVCVEEGPAECAADGGFNSGANSCTPDPCPASTTTSSTPATTSSSSTIPTTSSTSTIPTTSSSSTIPTTSSSSTIPTTSSTTTTPTTSSTSTSAPAQTRCCLASGSPEGAFTCTIISPASCADADGTDIGPGSCEPNPCVGTPSTSSSSTSIVPTTSSTSIIPTTSTSSIIPATSSTSIIPTTSSTSIIPTTSSTSIIPTTSSTSTSLLATTSSTSTTVTPTTSTTSTTSGGVTAFDFTSTAGSGLCGSTFRDLAGTIPLKRIICGNLSIGGGFSQVPDNVTPPGSTNRFSLSCNGADCTVGPVSPATAAYDCTNTGCLFGTPLPIANAGISVCVTNTFSQPVSGTLNTATGAATLNFQLNSATTLTGVETQPCPICAVAVGGAPCVGSVAAPCTGVCDGSANQGSPCTTTNPKGLTNQCPSPAVVTGTQRCYRGPNNNQICTSSSQCAGSNCAQFIGDIPISLNPLTTGVASLSSATGLFCPGQTTSSKGAFKSDICQTGANSGKPCTSATAVADCGAGISCRAGTANNYCTAGTNDGKGCATATDCGTGGVCARAGLQAQLIQLNGTPAGALTPGVAKAVKIGSAFCVPLTGSGIVNSNANLPAPGATVLAGQIKLIP